MAETQNTQAETTATRKGQQNGGAGAGTQEGRNMVSQESGGRSNHAVTSQRSRSLSATPQNPFSMMRQLSREMDRLMDSFFERGFGSVLRDDYAREDDWQPRMLWSPQIDVQQRNDALIVRADLPGIDKDDIRIEVEGDSLVISGQRREEREEGGDEQGYRLVERNYGSFHRSVRLPQGTNPDEITASMRDGVLTITLPLREEARPRRIEVQS